MTRSRVAVIGAGPAGLMAAEVLTRAARGYGLRAHAVGRAQVPDGRPRRPQPDAQRRSERLPRRYGAAAPPRCAPRSRPFRPTALRAWSEGLGQPTFVGSSGRVFPKALKASPLLRAWLRRLDAAGVRFGCAITGPAGTRRRAPVRDAGWPHRAFTPTPPSWRLAARAGRGSARTVAGRTCSTTAGIAVAPLRPANCGFLVDWSERVPRAFRRASR